MIRTTVGFALQFGLEVRWHRHGNVKFQFSPGPESRPAFVVYRKWVSVYTSRTDWRKMSSMDDFDVTIFPRDARSQFGY